MDLGADQDIGGDRDGGAWGFVDSADPDFLPLTADASDRRRKFTGAAGIVFLESAEALVGFFVVAAHVVAHHAMGVDEVAERTDAGLHAIDPTAGDAIGSAVVEGWNHVVLQHVVKGFGFDLVLVGEVVVGLTVADGPSDGRRILRIFPDFIPPAVERTEIENAVGGGFHAAGAAGFIGTEWSIEPDVDTLHETTSDGHVVVFQENDATAEFGIASQLHDLADEFLAGIVGGMGFAGKDELHGTSRIAQESAQARQVTED